MKIGDLFFFISDIEVVDRRWWIGGGEWEVMEVG